MRLKPLLLPIAAGVLLGGIVHIVVVLAIPLLASDKAWGRLIRTVPPDTAFILPPQTPDFHVLPYMSPDIRYLVCRYDVSLGPAIFAARLPKNPWSIGLHTSEGINYYTLDSKRLKRERIEIVIHGPDQATGEQDRSADDEDTGENGDDAITVKSPSLQGLVMLRALVQDLSEGNDTEKILAASSCRPQEAENG